MIDLVERARCIAYNAHHAQKDKAGKRYIEHVARVAAAVKGDAAAEALAWVHDVLEDAPNFAIEVFIADGTLYQNMKVISRPVGGPQDDYYRKVKENPTVLKVKLADIADNLLNDRLSLLPIDVANRLRRKYSKALAALSA